MVLYGRPKDGQEEFRSYWDGAELARSIPASRGFVLTALPLRSVANVELAQAEVEDYTTRWAVLGLKPDRPASTGVSVGIDRRRMGLIGIGGKDMDLAKKRRG
jgi:hypothetical protein